MKKILSITLILVSLASFAKAQTNWEDYRYVTAGLKDDLSKGKEVKVGYSMTPIAKESFDIDAAGIKRNFRLYQFKKGRTTQAFVISCWDSHNNYSYFCIPTSDAASDIWDASYKAFKSAGKEWQMVFAWGLAQVISQKL